MRPIDQVRMEDLLEDPAYARFISITPKLRSDWMPHPAWQVLVLTTEGKWQRALFSDYQKGLIYFHDRVHDEDVHDITLGCRREETAPPLLKIKTGQGIKRRRWNRIPDGHLWCGYCRRPTRFVKGLTAHHSFSGTFSQGRLDPSIRRCYVCGIPQSSIRTSWPISSQLSRYTG